MTDFTSFDALRAVCLDLPSGHPAASAAVAQREASLTKPPRSLGRLEDIVAWLAHWQGHTPPRLDRVDILVFAGNHGVTRLGVSAYPTEVTAQMVANFAAGGAAINQLARAANAELRVIPLALEAPTADFTQQPALTEQEFLTAVAAGYAAVSPECDLICLGEMGIGNTTAAAAIAAALFGGGGARWAGRGTGVDDAGLERKRAVIDRALDRHAALLHDPLAIAAAFGGRELAAILGATFAHSFGLYVAEPAGFPAAVVPPEVAAPHVQELGFSQADPFAQVRVGEIRGGFLRRIARRMRNFRSPCRKSRRLAGPRLIQRMYEILIRKNWRSAPPKRRTWRLLRRNWRLDDTP